MPSTRVAPRTVRQPEPSFDDGTIHSIGVAGLQVIKAPDKIRTVLGSCIGIALHDPSTKIGGLGHVILPDSKSGSGDPRKFADTAIDLLLEMLAAEGARRVRIVAKIVGGASMFGVTHTSDLGERNAEAVKERLAHHRIELLAEAIGGVKGRKMMLDATTGAIQVEIIGAARDVI